MININIIQKYNDAQIPENFKRTLKKIVHKAAIINDIKEPISLSLVIIDNKEIKALNFKYKKKNKATDILSFTQDFNYLYPLIKENALGDIFISFPQLVSNAKKYQHSLKREWYYLFTHGVLHLMGHDHLTEKEEQVMNQQAKAIMKYIKVGR